MTDILKINTEVLNDRVEEINKEIEVYSLREKELETELSVLRWDMDTIVMWLNMVRDRKNTLENELRDIGKLENYYRNLVNKENK